MEPCKRALKGLQEDMSQFDITLFYAFHGSTKDKHKKFPTQTLSSDRIQLISVTEDDHHHPRRRTLERAIEAEGRYTMFLDEGDLFEPADDTNENPFEPADAFLERMLDAADHCSEKAAFFMPSIKGQLVTRHPEYFSTDIPENIFMDANESPKILPTELHGLMIPTKELKEALSRASQTEPEKSALLYLFSKNSVFFYVGTCCVFYALPRECDYQYDTRCMLHEWYYDPFEKFLLPAMADVQSKTGTVPYAYQCLALHMIHIRIFANRNNRNKHIISPEEIPEYTELFSRVLQYVDLETLILQNNTSLSGARLKLLDVRLKKRDFSWYPDIVNVNNRLEIMCGDLRFTTRDSLNVRINLIDYRNGCLEIDGGIDNFFSEEHVSVYASFDGKKYPVVYNQRYSMTKCFGVTYTRIKTFHVSVPVPVSSKERTLVFVIEADGLAYQAQYAFVSQMSRFVKDLTYTYWKFGDYISYWKKKTGIHIVKYSKWRVLRKEIQLWRQIHKSDVDVVPEQLRLKIINFLLRPYFSRQKIWLFQDKIYKGGDSSEYIYRYAAAQNDGIKKYYLLDESCPDYARMRKDGYRPLKRGTLKHRLIFLNANMVIASNSTVFAFNDFTTRRSFAFRGDFHFDVACVQHGMSVQKIALAQHRLRDNTRLYFCASKYEIENLSKPVYDYVGYDALKLTGVPRYDGLKNRAQKIILLSPTWRMNSAMIVTKNEGVARDYNPNFRETSYYKVYNGLINDPRLLSAARQYGYRIQYVLHPIVSPQYEDFTKNEFVEIIPAIGDMSYEKLFCEAALMVTDFSGVQFDFAYMRKPVVYLHHDDIPQHYEEGTFHYTTMGFGEICHTNDELIDVLCEYMKNDCAMPELYRRRADDFFTYSDNKNCERIYPIMLEYERNRE